ncbi:unnamed protein product [Commensalibacter communis]|uniref:YARHG domain-containing protein n=1 Tax=Commensalibacter communis TaxID=2972786 RepID=A0A9W4XIK5_9PROT|nr:hypothetical protein [Commensalibacter communis]CAI3953953.1 unnamed protein product [Commensalibacter communis]CAI3956230.1 unnamed protein product [Commensalibacter communis]CAI3956621.1 unnamed protein product [Commensalibacter communis]CAI3957045.1 unnamed protein product [Commensalibacter communis]
MKKLLLMGAFALSLPTAVKAQQTVSQTTINRAINDAKQHFCTNGMSGFAKHIKNCYQKSGGVDKCLLEDISLSVFDHQFREAMKQQTGQEVPPSDVFFSQPVSEARYKKYFLPKFGNNNKGYSYLKPGIIQVTDTMGKCLDNTEKQAKTTTTRATTVSEAVVSEAVTDTKASFCSNSNKGNLTLKRLDFAQHILGCYSHSEQSPDKLPVCILEDLSFWVFDKNSRAASPIYDQNYPGDKQFFSAVDFNDRLQEYIAPHFGYLPDALNYFDPGINKVTDTMLSCVK